MRKGTGSIARLLGVSASAKENVETALVDRSSDYEVDIVSKNRFRAVSSKDKNCQDSFKGVRCYPLYLLDTSLKSQKTYCVCTPYIRVDGYDTDEGFSR